MPKTDTAELDKFLKPFSPEIQKLTKWLRNFVWTTCPDSNELIYDNYNALAIGFGLSDKVGDIFCSIAVYGKHVNFGFLRGHEINDPEKILTGAGKMYRYITIKEKKHLPESYIKKLLLESVINAQTHLKTEKQTLKKATIVKSVSSKKRRPG